MQDIKIIFNKNYDTYSIRIVDVDGNEKISYRDKVPTDFETLLDYINTFPSKFIQIYDNNTIFVKINKKQQLIIHKTLLKSHCDISVVNGSNRFANFLTLPINLIYNIICQFR